MLFPVCMSVEFIVMLGSSLFKVLISSVRSTSWAVQFSNMCLNVFGPSQKSAQQGISAMQFIFFRYSPVGSILWIYLKIVILSLKLVY